MLTCGSLQPACTKPYWPNVFDVPSQQKVYDEHPEADLPPHVWDADVSSEYMGFIGTHSDGFSSPHMIFHEFGHVVDLFTVPDLIGYHVPASGCAIGMKKGGVCAAACVPDSTDEADAVKETVAQMIDIFSVGRLYTTVEYARCDAISKIAAASGPAHDPACMDAPGDIKSFLDQRPVEPGGVEIDGMWLPTGKCHDSPGYHQSGIFQAWWEWTHARDCSSDDPFTCEQFTDEATGARSGIEALLFAMSQTNASYYRKLFTDMETYVACTDGPTRASRFRAVFCHHGALDCDLLPPVCPATCGDGKAELTEACDGDDLREQECSDHLLTNGTLACKPDCTFDFSACTEDTGTSGTSSTTGTSGFDPAPTPTTPTSGLDIPTTGADPTLPPPEPTDSEDPGSGEQAEDGCGCRGSNAAAGSLALILLALRRRRMDGVANAGVR